jgi:hypothetical protein
MSWVGDLMNDKTQVRDKKKYEQRNMKGGIPYFRSNLNYEGTSMEIWSITFSKIVSLPSPRKFRGSFAEEMLSGNMVTKISRNLCGSSAKVSRKFK